MSSSGCKPNPYQGCPGCHRWGGLHSLLSCLWSKWPSPGSQGPGASLPMHTEHTHTHTCMHTHVYSVTEKSEEAQQKGSLTFSYGQWA